jgi:hypothetical protein
MSIPFLPLDLWYEVFGLLDIDEAIAVSKASPRIFGAFIDSKQGIRFRNAINSYMRSTAMDLPVGLLDLPVGSLSSFVCSVSRGSSLKFSALISWLARRFRPALSSSIVANYFQLFTDLSSTIALKDRGFVSVSSSLNSWTVELKAEDGSVSSVSWILLYRASISGYRAADFHRACNGAGKCVVVVKAANGRIAVAYNDDGFTSVIDVSPNLNGFIVSVAADGGCGEIFYRNNHGAGVLNYDCYSPFLRDYPDSGPIFGMIANGDEAGFDLIISDDCHQNENSSSSLGMSYGKGPGLNQNALFEQESFRVVDYEVFKIVIE